MSEFEPTRFNEACQRAILEHPSKRSEGPHGATTDEIQWLKSELDRRTVPEIGSFSATLRPRQLRAAVGLVTDELVGEKADLVVRSRPRATLFQTVWARLRKEYPEARLDSLLRFLAKACGEDERRKIFPLATRIDAWLTADRLALGASRQWERERLAYDVTLDAWLEALEIPRGERFHAATVREFVAGASFDVLRTIGSGEYLNLATACPIEVRAQAMARYLNTLGGRDQWNIKVLEAFEEWFGKPQGGDVENKYWSPVNRDARLEFKAWALGRQVEHYFSQFADQTGRGAFWRPFVEQYGVDIHLRCPSGPGEFLAIGMEFRRFGVVEFARVGNAAYFYPPDTYRSIVVNQSTGDESFFKARDRTIRRVANESVDGRLIHQEGWQHTWSRRVDRLIRGG